MAGSILTPSMSTSLCDISEALRLDGTYTFVLDTSVMDALVIFSSENNHPLSWLLTSKRRHVWCAVRDTDRGHWISYDWGKGIPTVRCEAASDFDLRSHYQAQGFEVLETTVGDTPPHGPLQWNNCVGHVKTMLAIDTYALVPNGLYKHLTRSNLMASLFRTLTFIPGFGSQAAAAPLPTPVAPVAPQSDMAKRADKTMAADAAKRKKAQLATTTTTDNSSTLLTKKAY